MTDARAQLAESLCEQRLYRTQYLVLPRLVIAAMPVEWQARLEELLALADDTGMESPSYVVLRDEPGYTRAVLSDPDDEYGRVESYDVLQSDEWADYRRGDAKALCPQFDAAKAEPGQ